MPYYCQVPLLINYCWSSFGMRHINSISNHDKIIPTNMDLRKHFLSLCVYVCWCWHSTKYECNDREERWLRTRRSSRYSGFTLINLAPVPLCSYCVDCQKRYFSNIPFIICLLNSLDFVSAYQVIWNGVLWKYSSQTKHEDSFWQSLFTSHASLLPTERYSVPRERVWTS